MAPTSFAKPTSALYLQIPRKAYCNIVMHGIDGGGENCSWHPWGFIQRGGATALQVTLEIMSVSLMQTFRTWLCLPFLEMKKLTIVYCGQEPMFLSR